MQQKFLQTTTTTTMYRILIICGFLLTVSTAAFNNNNNNKYLRSFVPQPLTIDPCYDEDRPRRCMPDFVNIAFGSNIEASSTCGTNSNETYCDADGKCHTCDINEPSKSFPATARSDIHNLQNVTCWRSEPRSIANTNFGHTDSTPDNVTLTLSFGKKFLLLFP